jgi:hypothetical protein
MKIELEAGDTETLQKLKDKAMMLKIICLDDLGKDPLFDVSRMNKREKVRLQVEVEKRWNVMPDADIIEQFNEICIQTIFDTQGPEYENMPVTSVGRPQLPKEEVERISLLPEDEQKRICGKVLCPQLKEKEEEPTMEVVN